MIFFRRFIKCCNLWTMLFQNLRGDFLSEAIVIQPMQRIIIGASAQMNFRIKKPPDSSGKSGG